MRRLFFVLMMSTLVFGCVEQEKEIPKENAFLIAKGRAERRLGRPLTKEEESAIIVTRKNGQWTPTYVEPLSSRLFGFEQPRAIPTTIPAE